MADTPNNTIPLVPENVLDPAAGLNQALDKIDGPLQLSVLGIEDAPPSGSTNGDRYIVGVGSGDWTGEDNRIARYIEDGDFWEFFDAYYCVNQADGCFYCFIGGIWVDMVCAPS